MDDQGELHPVVQVLAILLAVAAGIWATWCTVIAFTGGTMPLIGVETDGGLGFGLVFLFFLEPIAITIAYWFSVLLLMPLQLLLGATDRKRGEKGGGSGRRYHASFGNGRGVTFFAPDDVETSLSWSYDSGMQDDLDTEMLVEAALAELEISLGRPPSFPHSMDSPFYTAHWDPPLARVHGVDRPNEFGSSPPTPHLYTKVFYSTEGLSDGAVAKLRVALRNEGIEFEFDGHEFMVGTSDEARADALVSLLRRRS